MAPPHRSPLMQLFSIMAESLFMGRSAPWITIACLRVHVFFSLQLEGVYSMLILLMLWIFAYVTLFGLTSVLSLTIFVSGFAIVPCP
jgi:hypothetical protein